MVNNKLPELELREELNKDTSLDNIILLAGAGSGKTSFVVENVISQIENGVDIEKIVVISFTKKAAAEVRGRIYEGLKKIQNPSKKITLALEKFDLFIISTIHSFCYKLLSENAFYLNLPIDLTLLDENQNNERIESFFKDFVKKDTDYLDLPIYTFKSDYYNLTYETFKSLISFSKEKQIIKPNQAYISTIHDTIHDTIQNLINKIISYLISINDDFVSTNSSLKDKFLKYKKGFTDLTKINSINPMDESFKSIISQMIENKDSTVVAVVGNNGKEFNKDHQKIYDTMYDLVMKIKVLEADLVFDYAIKLRNNYFDYLKSTFELNRISNDQILWLTDELLSINNSNLLSIIRNKYSIIYVDEAQDVDPYQIRIAEKMSYLGETEGNNHKLIIVGDPKQSIYAFRGANIELFNSTIKKQGKKYHYTYNFNYRSNNHILDFINKKFAPKFTKMFGSYSNMIPPSKDNKAIPHSSIHLPSKPVINDVYKYHSSSNSLLSDALKIIKDLVERGSIWDGEKYRDIVYSDFLLILKATDGSNTKCYKFKESDIKTISSASVGQKNNVHLIKLINLYKAIIYTYDEECTFLGQQVLINDILTNKNELKGYHLLNQLKLDTNGLSPLSILRYLLNNYPSYCKGNYSKAQLDTLMMDLTNIYEEIATSDTLTSNEIISKLELKLNGCIEYDLPLIYHDNAIEIMNQHKTKGLQRNIVLMMGVNKKSERVPFSLEKDNNVYIFGPRYGGDNPGTYNIYLDPDSEARKQVAIDRNNEETTRLEYVALTRAKQALIYLYTNTSNDKGQPKDEDIWLYDDYFIDQKDLYETHPELAPNQDKTLNCKDGNALKYTDGNKLKCKPMNVEIDLVTPRFIAISPSSLENKLSISSSEETSLKGRLFGNVMHRALELMVNDIAINNLNDSLDIYSIQAVNENDDDIRLDKEFTAIDYKDETVKVLQKFKSSSFFNLIKDAERVETEFPFSIYVSFKDVNNFNFSLGQAIIKANNDLVILDDTLLWLNGKADLVVFNKDKTITIIDYKSDVKNKTLTENQYIENLHKKYDNQQDLYAFVLSKYYSINAKNIKNRIYFYR